MVRKIFGTDGVRGTANLYPMTSEMALALGRAVAYKVRTKDRRKNKIILGKDTRLSCYMLEMAFASGVCSMGVDVLMLGPMPTPGVAYLIKDMRADAGVVISASHNPYEDNGIKIFGKDGFKLTDVQEDEIEQYVLSHYTVDQMISPDDSSYPKKDLVGKAFKVDDAKGRYISHLKRVFPVNIDLCGFKIAIDCANGAAYNIAPKVLEELGAEVVVIGNQPNGTNINANCGAMHPAALSRVVVDNQCDLGIALDGDADRLVVVDENGAVVHGDALLAIASLDSTSLVATHMSTIALDEFVKQNGGHVVRTNVGDRYVLQEMKKAGLKVGGEQSGHIIHLKHSTTGDGMVAALKLLATLKRMHTTMSELSKIITPYPQYLINVPVRDKKTPVNDIDDLKDAIDSGYNSMNGEGRVIVRYSGTENKLRIMVESKNGLQARKVAESIEKAAKQTIGI